MASRHQDLTAAALEEAANHLTPQALEAAKGAAAIMGMNNVFYRFTHLSSNDKYATMRAGLRMNVIRTHCIDQLDFELWCTAASAINGCGACVGSHDKLLRGKRLRRREDNGRHSRCSSSARHRRRFGYGASRGAPAGECIARAFSDADCGDCFCLSNPVEKEKNGGAWRLRFPDYACFISR